MDNSLVLQKSLFVLWMIYLTLHTHHPLLP